MRRYSLIAIVFLVLVACSAAPQQVVVVTSTTLPAPTSVPTTEPSPTPEPCLVQSEEYLGAAEQQLEAWADASLLANSTPRASLSPVIGELQDIRRNVEDLTPPDCAMSIQYAMLRGMEAMINGYLAFLADQPELTVNDRFVEAVGFLDEAHTRLAWLEDGEDPAQVLPTPTPAPIELADGSMAALPATLVITPLESAPDIEVRESPGGKRRDCRATGGTEVRVVESQRAEGGVIYARIEGSNCDGWVTTVRLQ